MPRPVSRAPATRWTFAEGATGDYFETFLSVINPGDADLVVEAQVRLQDGSTSGGPLRFTRVVPARTRRTLWLDREVSDEGISLGGRDGISVELTADRRASWRSGRCGGPGRPSTWHEAHVAAGFSEPSAATWRLAGGEYLADPAGGDPRVQTYVLVANVGGSPEDVDVTVYFEHREPVHAAVAGAGQQPGVRAALDARRWSGVGATTSRTPASTVAGAVACRAVVRGAGDVRQHAAGPLGPRRRRPRHALTAGRLP